MQISYLINKLSVARKQVTHKRLLPGSEELKNALNILVLHDREDGPEYLVLHDFRVQRGVRENGRGDVVSFVVSFTS